jgi:hypothetical protein
MEHEHGIGGKNSPIHYIPEQDPIQEALETKHQPMSFKLTLPMGSEMRITRWASGTPEHFLIHVRGAIHAIKEMGLNIKFQEAVDAAEYATWVLEIAKTGYKQEQKKGEGDEVPQQAVGAGKASTAKPKKLKKVEGEEPPPPAIVAAKAALDKACKERIEAQE